MVSKVAVIALVGILAIPILLGYGMNFEQTTDTRYVPGEQVTDVTSLLKTGVSYSYAAANIYSLNTFNFISTYDPYQTAMKALPDYNSFTQGGAKSILPMIRSYSNVAASNDLTQYAYFTVSNPDTGLNSTVYYYDSGGNSQSITLNDTTFVTFIHEENKIYVSQYIGYNRVTTSYSNPYRIDFSGTQISSPNLPYVMLAYLDDSQNTGYVDIAAGFKFPRYTFLDPPFTSYGPMFYFWSSPGRASELLLTIDLDSIDPSEEKTYFWLLDDTYLYPTIQLLFEKSTVNGDLVWTVNGQEIIYDNTGTNGNCYQILFKRSGAEVRYVGAWPNVIGAANVYRTYEIDWTDPIAEDEFIYGFGGYGADNLGYGAPYSMTMRMDSAAILDSQHDAIANVTYDPAYITGYSSFETSLNVVYSPGKSLTFGGHVYSITDGNITINGHKIPVNKMKLSSSVNADGNYENKINGTIVSTTATPSTITFTGIWEDLAVNTRSLETETYTVNVWVPGQFAWDGLDSNFLMVGLMTSFGAFIALAIYSRRSRVSLWPLMLICGGAAALFLFML